MRGSRTSLLCPYQHVHTALVTRNRQRKFFSCFLSDLSFASFDSSSPKVGERSRGRFLFRVGFVGEPHLPPPSPNLTHTPVAPSPSNGETSLSFLFFPPFPPTKVSFNLLLFRRRRSLPAIVQVPLPARVRAKAARSIPGSQSVLHGQATQDCARDRCVARDRPRSRVSERETRSSLRPSFAFPNRQA